MFPMLPFPTPREVIIFALVLSRVAGIFAALPVFGGTTLSLRIKVVIVIMITLACYPGLAITPPPAMPSDAFALGLLAGREIMVGVTLSFITKVIFSAVEFSGQIIGLQMGFTMSSILDPALGHQVQIMSVMQTLLATLMFLAMNIHHLFIHTIADSFRIIPLGGWHLNSDIISFLIKCTADILVLGVRLAAPVMVALLLTSVTLGIMARAFPQMNVFMVSMPLNIGIGFVVLGITLPIFFHVLEMSFGAVHGQIETLFRMMAKGG